MAISLSSVAAKPRIPQAASGTRATWQSLLNRAVLPVQAMQDRKENVDPAALGGLSVSPIVSTRPCPPGTRQISTPVEHLSSSPSVN